MKTKDIQILGRLLCPQEVSEGRGGAAIRHWIARQVFALLPALCLVPLLATAADNRKPNGQQLSPSTEAAPKAPSSGETPSTSASATIDDGAKPAMVFSGGIMDALDGKQKLGVGDTIIFRVLEDQEDPKPLSVTDSGELDVPELGLVPAAGKTCKQLAFELKSKLEQTTYYRATVILGVQLLNKTISGRRVYLAGQVKITGPQEIPAGEAWTVSRAIMGAGGFTDYADKKSVRVVRAGAKGTPGKTFILNITDVWEKGQTEKDLSVEPEDLIYVPGRAVNF
jgi:polysaccharide export outer membrane protein